MLGPFADDVALKGMDLIEESIAEVETPAGSDGPRWRGTSAWEESPSDAPRRGPFPCISQDELKAFDTLLAGARTITDLLGS